MASQRRNFGGRSSRGFHTNYSFEEHSSDQEQGDIPYPSYYQGTFHYQDRLVENDTMDQEMDTQELHVDHAGALTTHADAQETVSFGGNRFPRTRGQRGYHRQNWIGNASNHPINKIQGGIGSAFRSGFNRGGSQRFRRGNRRSFIRRQKDLQKKFEWTNLDQSLRGKGQNLKIDLSSHAAANLSLDEIISRVTDNVGADHVSEMSLQPDPNIKSDCDDAVNLNLGEIISKSQAINLT